MTDLPLILQLIQRGRDYGMDEDFLRGVLDTMQEDRPAGVYAVAMGDTTSEALLTTFARHVRDQTDAMYETWRGGPDQEIGAAIADLHDAAVVVLDAVAGEPSQDEDT